MSPSAQEGLLELASNPLRPLEKFLEIRQRIKSSHLGDLWSSGQVGGREDGKQI